MNALQLAEYIRAGKADATLNSLYGKNLDRQRKRYADACEKFAELYGADKDAFVFSVPGRSEISGNHTDHNKGKVLAGAIDLDIIAIAAKTDDGLVRVRSEGYSEDRVDLSDIAEPKQENFFKSRGLIAGVCAGLKNKGFDICSFCAYTTNDVHKGSGLSSSAAFEVMIGNILNHLANGGKIDNPEIAKISQFAENVYFGKPCGLMDQTACAVGGFVAIDFADPTKPVIEPIEFDLSGKGYSLCIINTGGNHADLNDDYASVPAEMKAIAAYYGKDALRGLTEEDLIKDMPVLRKAAGDRAIMRAMHFVAENKRVEKQTEALRAGNLDEFFGGVFASGNSSFKYLQNVYTTKNVAEQGLSLALCVTEYITSGWGGAFRVHGGGFAGTIQAFIPTEKVEEYKGIMDSVFGEGACAALKIRPEGAIIVNL
ncbi:MAG: galactokinase [Clostridia bacterium]|nr:galactokinase [Clostridia bacterium]MBQ1934634.1 galactokinase [Clostridia bacterium]MBQ5649716.1 galactokinase [Clostridia bacterium]